MSETDVIQEVRRIAADVWVAGDKNLGVLAQSEEGKKDDWSNRASIMRNATEMAKVAGSVKIPVRQPAPVC